MYINEIEKANDYLKSLVSQSYDSLHTSERFKQEFIAKVNHIENRQYFHRKRKALNISGTEHSREGRSRQRNSPMQRLDPDRIRGLSGVRLPHNVYKNLLKEKSVSATNELNLFNRVSVSPDSKNAEDSKSFDPSNEKNESEQKESLGESKAIEVSDIQVEVKPDGENEVPKLKNGFYDMISFES